MTIGRFGVTTLIAARKYAREKFVQIGNAEDPLAVRRRAALGSTVRQLCKLYIERHAKPKKRSWKEDERRLTKWIISRYGNQKLDSITRLDIAKIHLSIGKKHLYEANRVLEIVRKMYGLAEDWGLNRCSKNSIK